MARFIDEKQARRTIDRWRASGLGVVQFAKREGISVGTFYRRRAKVDAVDAEPDFAAVEDRSGAAPMSTAPASSFEFDVPAAAGLGLVPVVIRPSSAPAGVTAGSPFEVELTSGIKIRVAVGFDAAELVRLAEALTGVRC